MYVLSDFNKNSKIRKETGNLLTTAATTAGTANLIQSIAAERKEIKIPKIIKKNLTTIGLGLGVGSYGLNKLSKKKKKRKLY